MFSKIIKTIIGVGIMMLAIILQISWIGICFSTVILGIALLIFAPRILFLPFNILFPIGLVFLASAKSTYSYNYQYRNYQQNNQNYQRKNESKTNPINNSKDPYEIIGCNKNDDINTIKQAYRAQVRKFHPDLLGEKNLDEEFIKFANQKMQEINQAYEEIKKQKGF